MVNQVHLVVPASQKCRAPHLPTLLPFPPSSPPLPIPLPSFQPCLPQPCRTRQDSWAEDLGTPAG
jgi:hypothetical protein